MREQPSIYALLALLAGTSAGCSATESSGPGGGAPTSTAPATNPTASSSGITSSQTSSSASSMGPGTTGVSSTSSPTTTGISGNSSTSNDPVESSSPTSETDAIPTVSTDENTESSETPVTSDDASSGTHEPGATSGPGNGETFGPDIDEACNASESVNSNASGSGPYDVVVETNSDPGINEGTIFRPAELGGAPPFPVLVWGEGGCSLNGLSNASAMAEIASHGYVVVADGTPNGSGSRSLNSNDVVSMGEPLIGYIDWLLRENVKPCSAYYHSMNASKVSANGFSCGGLMAMGTAADPRITTWGITSSGLFGANQAFYSTVDTPVIVIVGNETDQANPNGRRDYDNLSAAGVPIMFFEDATAGHGGDLFQQGGGDFNKINLAWLNWWLKGDETATGKGLLVGPECPYCTDSNWEVLSANLP